jgi:4-amino-4-deoxy-L-arabinose transferase-like glycosyltransferase
MAGVIEAALPRTAGQAVAGESGSVRRIAAVLVLAVTVVWCAAAWSTLRPAAIVGDWNGWRQTDTQTIALNFTKGDSHILRPQISWGGDGPGYVETEFQSYTAAVSMLLRIFGDAEWPGQLLSLLAIAAACGVVFTHAARQYSPYAALVAALTFLAARPSVHLATVVMPDALALLGYVVAWMFFWRYAVEGRTRTW